MLWTTEDHARKIGELKGDHAAVEKKVAQGFGFEGPNALLDTLVDAAEALGRESGRRRALVGVAGAGAGHASLTLLRPDVRNLEILRLTKIWDSYFALSPLDCGRSPH